MMSHDEDVAEERWTEHDVEWFATYLTSGDTAPPADAALRTRLEAFAAFVGLDVPWDKPEAHA